MLQWFLQQPNAEISVRTSEPGVWRAEARLASLEAVAVAGCPFEAKERAVERLVSGGAS